MLKKLVILFTLLFLIACSNQKEKSSNNLTENENRNDITVVASNLSAPWAIQKNDNEFYISERSGTIALINNGEVVHEKVNLQEPLSTVSEAGLLGFVLAPNFKETSEAFAYYTYEKNENIFNRIIRLKRNDGVWKEMNVLIDEIPSGAYHHGGRLEIGPDGKLYATTGDAVTPEIAQDLNSLGGKILRINLDGTSPSDNPIENSYIYSYGHRNPQGIAWSTDGHMYASEHGPNANDEINEIFPYQNYGWPTIVGEQKHANMNAPMYTSGNNETWAPSGMIFYNNALYVAALRGTAILKFDLTSKSVERIVDNVGRVRDVWIEDDELYFITNNTDGRGNPSEVDDRLLKINLKDYNK